MKESEYFKSEKFKEDFRKTIEKETWDKDIPMIYINDNGDIVGHFKDGTIKIIKENAAKKE